MSYLRNCNQKLKPVHKILSTIVIFLVLGCFTASAQYGVQVSYIAPDGNNIYIFKPAVGVELKYTTGAIDTSSRVRFAFSIGYYKLSPTQDTFSNYLVSKGKLYPGYDIVKNYSVIPVAAGVEYHPFEGRLTPYIGMDLDFFLINYSYHSYVEMQYDDNKTETDLAISAIPKIGLSYQIGNNWLLSAGIGYSIEIASSSNVNSQSYFKSTLGLTYYLNK